jgi:hypothetical protein
MRLPQSICQAFFSLVIAIAIFPQPVTGALAANVPKGNAGSDAAAGELLTWTPVRLQFGEVVVGQTKNALATIANRGGSSLTVLGATSTGAEFTLNGLNLPLTLSGGESFTFSVTFSPRERGVANGSISVISGASKKTLTMRLEGTGTRGGQLSITPAIIDFGDLTVGSNGTQMGELTAIGSSVTVSSATVNSSNFELSGLSLPVTIPAGSTVPFTVRFVPRDNGTSSATLSFSSNAENSPNEQPVKATVVRTHKVRLSWKASTSKHVVGYNIYRGNRPHGPYKRINRILDPNTSFTDVTVAAGHKYYYLATAVNWRKRESVHSKHVRVVVP